jgi:S1-C subfamily serine protease
VVVTATGQLASTSLVPPPIDWVPANTKQEGKQLQGNLKGVNDTLDVTLAGKESRMASQLKQTSDRHDVALIKVDVPGQLTKVELFDNYETLKKGEQVTIMGYPAASPAVYGVIKSSDVFNQGTQIKIIPDPTVTTTNIGNIIRDSDEKSKDKRVSMMGDVIQLATGSTGSGNSGGPVFDSQGRVIGIFFAGQQADAITYAVPIRYGKEFLATE